MACSFPVRCFRSKSGPNPDTGRWPIVSRLSDGYEDMPVIRPCGKCTCCRLEQSRQRAVRLVHEHQMHDSACFVTLTYDDDHLPPSNIDGGLPSLTRGQNSEFTLMMKRLRKSVDPLKLRFYQCGEYGDQTQRPHHHMILFGFDFIDDRELVSRGEHCLYRSARLTAAWNYGNAYFGDVTFESAAYVASYSIKKLTGPLGPPAYENLGRIPPYSTSSNRPGIGYEWIKKYTNDVYPRDSVVCRGREMKPPRYYDDFFETVGDFKSIAKKRVELASERIAIGNGNKGVFTDINKSKKIEFCKNEKI